MSKTMDAYEFEQYCKLVEEDGWEHFYSPRRRQISVLDENHKVLFYIDTDDYDIYCGSMNDIEVHNWIKENFGEEIEELLGGNR